MERKNNMAKTDALQPVVSAKLPEDLLKFLEDYRWTNRLTRSELIVEAIDGWAKTKGFVPDNNNPTETGEPT